MVRFKAVVFLFSLLLIVQEGFAQHLSPFHAAATRPDPNPGLRIQLLHGRTA